MSILPNNVASVSLGKEELIFVDSNDILAGLAAPVLFTESGQDRGLDRRLLRRRLRPSYL